MYIFAVEWKNECVIELFLFKDDAEQYAIKLREGNFKYIPDSLIVTTKKVHEEAI